MEQLFWYQSAWPPSWWDPRKVTKVLFSFRSSSRQLCARLRNQHTEQFRIFVKVKYSTAPQTQNNFWSPLFPHEFQLTSVPQSAEWFFWWATCSSTASPLTGRVLCSKVRRLNRVRDSARLLQATAAFFLQNTSRPQCRWCAESIWCHASSRQPRWFSREDSSTRSASVLE